MLSSSLQSAFRRTSRALLASLGVCASLLGACAGRSSSAALASASADPAGSTPWFADEHPELTLRDLRLFGSHNSYHRAPRIKLSQWFAYDHGSLERQLDTGLRQFELDVRYVRGSVRVGHLPVVDGRTHCDKLEDCLRSFKRWSKAHPDHMPIVVFIEPKEDLVPSSLGGRIDAIDGVIRHIIPRSRLLTPDDVRANYGTLREAAAAQGLARLSDARGKMVFVLFGGEQHAQAYAAGNPTLRGRAMFAATRDVRAPFATVVNVDDPQRDHRRLQNALENGLLVRTRADRGLKRDAALRRVALESGAQFVSSDFVTGLDDWLGLNPFAPARCNPLSTIRTCASRELSEISRARWSSLKPPLERVARR